MKDGRSARPWLRATALRAALLAGAWVLIGADDPSPSIPFGVIAVALAVTASLAFSPPATTRLAPLELPGYAANFVYHSLLAGIDVARRALSPRLSIAPTWQHYTVHLPPGAPRSVLLGTLTLLPGTLAAEIEGDELWVHVLDEALPVEREFAAWERRVARLFRLEPPGSKEDRA